MTELAKIGAPAFPPLDELIRPDRVHSSLYTDPAIFEEEIDRIFHKGWLFIGHGAEIPNKGDFRARKMGRQPVIFVRDQNGRLQVLMNRCTHRGNAVCHLTRGNAPGFTCPYHGWRFRLDGELAAVPYVDRYGPDFDKSTLGLTPVPRVDEYRGFVFAALDPNVMSLDDHFGPLVKPELDDIIDLSPTGEIDMTAGYHHLAITANWKIGIENTIDGYHANFAHKAFLTEVQRRTGKDASGLASSSAPATVHSIGRGHGTWDSRTIIQAAKRPGEEPDNPEWIEYLAAMYQAHGQERADYVLAKKSSHVFIFPNFSYTGHHFRHYHPVAVDRFELSLLPFLLKGAPDGLNERRLRHHEHFYGPCALGGQSDDIEVFERNQRGMSAGLAPWILLSRGLHLEKQEADGSVSNQITDELSNRAIWARYKEDMSSRGGE